VCVCVCVCNHVVRILLLTCAPRHKIWHVTSLLKYFLKFCSRNPRTDLYFSCVPQRWDDHAITGRTFCSNAAERSRRRFTKSVESWGEILVLISVGGGTMTCRLSADVCCLEHTEQKERKAPGVVSSGSMNTAHLRRSCTFRTSRWSFCREYAGPSL